MDKLFGGRPLIVIMKLVALSVVVGIVLAALDLTPQRLLLILQRVAVRIYDMGFDAVAWAGQYFVLGAVIVIPIWLLSRLFASGKAKRDE